IMNFNIQQLAYIIALDNYGSFSQAAVHCNVTQPTLSMQVKKIEEELGVVIFDRSRKPLKTTEEGAAILDQARIIMQEVNILKEHVKIDSDTASGILTIGIIPTIAPYLVPVFVGNFLRKFPEIKVHIRELKTEEITDALKKEKIDFGILATPLREQGIHEYPLFYEKMICYADEQIAGAYRNRIGINDILSHKIWLLSEGNCFRNQVFNLCAMDQIAFKNFNLSYESGSVEALMRLVDKEGGLTFIPELATLDMHADQLDRLKFIADHNPVREISIVQGRRAMKKKLIDLFSAELLKALPAQIRENTHENIIEIS
ncbi:MAG: LysR substrate-binding domain-containing protein, partial [Cyclobacteriaceae bacterium]